MPKSKNLRIIGLRKYLNETAEQHNALGYDMFIKLHDVAKIGPINLARAFNVSKNTMYKWVKVHNETAILNEAVADAIVSSNVNSKQKGKL